MKRLVITLLVCVSGLVPAAAEEAALKFAALGDFRVENGQVIKNLKLGYRTLGQLNADRSNAVLFPTWFTGRSKDLAAYAGPGKLVDTSKYFVILVDALGDGISSSPSNSLEQPHMRFPQFNIRDMVRAEYNLATQELKLRHLRAVMGISMGGMQTFQWMVSYPDFMDKAIPIVGSPQLASYDLLVWTAEEHALEADPAWKDGEYTSPPLVGLTTAADVQTLILMTPQEFARRVAPRDFPQFLDKSRHDFAHVLDANDRIRQLQAMLAHDVSAPFGSSMQQAAATVRAQVLVIVDLKDHAVNPAPALNFAKLLSAPTLELDSDCGHMGFQCEAAKVDPAVAQFLDR